MWLYIDGTYVINNFVCCLISTFCMTEFLPSMTTTSLAVSCLTMMCCCIGQSKDAAIEILINYIVFTLFAGIFGDNFKSSKDLQ